MKIYLIGPSGVGKTFLGMELSKKLNLEFIDLDCYIEEHSMMFIEEIFDGFGEEYFRALEHNYLKELQEKDNIVVSCGGGIVELDSNKELLNGIVIFIDAYVSEIEERVKKSLDIRPIYQTRSIQYMYDRRKNKYEDFSNYHIYNHDASIALKEILEVINNA